MLKIEESENYYNQSKYDCYKLFELAWAAYAPRYEVQICAAANDASKSELG